MPEEPKKRKKYYCNGFCQRELGPESFYKSNNEKYAANDGFLFKCKKCITQGVDNWDPSTYLPILEECDVPYLPWEWNNLMKKYCQDPSKVTGLTVVGRYLALMRLNQNKFYRWADSEYLQEVERKSKENILRSQGLSEAEVQQTIEKQAEPPIEKPPEPEYDPSVARNDGWKTAEEVGLTEEDVNYLTVKWGSEYRPEEWIKLEDLWNDMNNSYDIQTAGERDTLKMICKTSIKAHQLIGINDIDGYQKMIKVYDSLMKSAKLTAAQNKEDENAINCIGKFVALCEEKQGFIPQYYTPEPQDRVDETLADTKRYLRNLVSTEANLETLMDIAAKQIKEEDERTEEDAINDIMNFDIIEEQKLEDYEQMRAFEEEEIQKDEELIDGID